MISGLNYEQFRKERQLQDTLYCKSEYKKYQSKTQNKPKIKTANAVTDIKKKFKTPFIGVPKFMSDDRILRNNQNKTMLYLFLLATEWDYSSIDDTLDVFGRFFVKRKLLASSWSLNTLVELFGVKSKQTIINWINQLENEGAIMRWKDWDEEKGCWRPTVYILGYIDGEGYYYYLYGNSESVNKEIIKRLGKE